MFLSDLSIKRPIFMSMVLTAIVLFGVIAFRSIGVDLYPKIDFPVVTVVSTLPATDPETIEMTVTDPIEEAMSTINSIKHLRSISAEGVSQVVLEFELEKDGNVAFQEVQAKLGSIVSKLPQDLIGPIVEKFDVDSAPIITVIVSGNLPVADLTHLIDKEIEQPLRRIPKIGQIKIVGGRETKIWLWVDRDKLQAYGLALQDIEQAIRSQHLDLPAGRITSSTSEIVLKTKGEFQTPQKFEELIVATRNGVPIHFKDVGRVEEGEEEERSSARLNQKSAIALLIGRQSGANSVELAHRIKAEVELLKEKLEARDIHLSLAQDNSLFIEHSIDEVRFHLFFGGGLAILIVLLFLRNLRSTFVCALALPTAVIGTFGIMSYLGFTQNMMTLLALSIAIGLLIDDAIVVQENIIRRLEEGESNVKAASEGTKQIALAVLATTLSVVAVFVPVAFMKGIVGRFFYQFGLTVSFAVLISMFVSFTLNPMFSSKVLKPMKKGKLYSFLERGFEGLENGYAALLKIALKYKKTVLVVAAVSFVGAIFLGKFLRFEFIPMQDQSEFSINFKAPQEASLNYTLQVMEKIEQRVKDKPWVDYLFTTIGSDSFQSVNLGSIYVKMPEKEERSTSQMDAMQEMRRELADISDGLVTIEAVQRMGGGRKMTDLQFEIRGPSLETLSTIASGVVEKMKQSKGYVDISSSFEAGKPQLDISIKREAAADLGISPLAIASAIRAAFGGVDISSFNKAGDRYDVSLRFSDQFRRQIDQIQQITVRSGNGALVPLRHLIELHKTTGPTQIDRYGRVRQITLFSNLNRSEKVLGEAIQEINTFMKEAHLPFGYSYDFTGAASNFKESFGHLVFALFLAVILVYMVLAAQFESFIHPFIIMLSLPLSLVGAIGALVISGMTMSIFTMIGIIMLMGLVTKNGILLIDFIKSLSHTMTREEAIINAGKMRLRPILMTTLAVIFGMLPVALGTGSGSESRAPMAVAVIGGLMTSTLLTLLVIPVVYELVEKLRDKKTQFFNTLLKRKVDGSPKSS